LTGDAGPAARAAMALASLPLRAATALRRTLRGAGLLRAVVLPAPVLSVGNLAAGGTGKTPLVEALARMLLAAGARPVVLSRGYGPAVAGEALNDEGLVLAANLPGLAQRQGADRAAAGAAALAAGEGDCLLLDDGFQHLRLARDLDLVAVDAARPFGGGLFREGPAALRHAGVVVLTGADRAGPGVVEALAARVAALAPGAAVAAAAHEPLDLLPVGVPGAEGGAAAAGGGPAASLRGRKVAAAAGIARPASFRATLEALGAKVVAFEGFPDHRLESAGALARLAAEGRAAGAELLVVTQKDAVKIARHPAPPGGVCAATAEGLSRFDAATPLLPVVALRVRLRFLSGEDGVRRAAEAALARGRARAAAGGAAQ
jgi:tetraacyldisaccharide 4'-kinase